MHCGAKWLIAPDLPADDEGVPQSQVGENVEASRRVSNTAPIACRLISLLTYSSRRISATRPSAGHRYGSSLGSLPLCAPVGRRGTRMFLSRRRTVLTDRPVGQQTSRRCHSRSQLVARLSGRRGRNEDGADGGHQYSGRRAASRPPLNRSGRD